ncbi:hypothetical protein [Klebsiella pneumoniae]|uniref:hypothetical protein n=1 Tax=Klebsiella pneumoniae TaxID=573 RepID=UPI000C7CE385|nr:hypothetical protein [Klebsiella pneumoniae]PLE30448.1 hypothetical protein B6I70_25595 [Klebsiella pneumoniae]
MTSKYSIDNRELLQRISSGEAVVGIDFGNLIVRELAAFRLAAMDSEPVAEVVSIYGDPEAFGEREIRLLVGIQQMPYGTKLCRHAQPVPDVVGKLLAILDRHTVELGWGEKPITLAELVIARDGSDELNACRAAMLSGGKS